MIYAGFWVRLGAHLIDFILVNLVELGIEYGIATPLGMPPLVQQVFGVIISLVLCYFYYIELPQRRGTTFGKKVFKIYVVDAQTGEQFTRKQAWIRLGGYILSYVIVGCGFLMAAFHPQKRGLHDLLAGTVCIRRKQLQVPELAGEQAERV